MKTEIPKSSCLRRSPIILLFMVEITNFCRFKDGKPKNLHAFGTLLFFIVEITDFCPFKGWKFLNISRFRSILFMVQKLTNFYQFEGVNPENLRAFGAILLCIVEVTNYASFMPPYHWKIFEQYFAEAIFYCLVQPVLLFSFPGRWSRIRQ